MKKSQSTAASIKLLKKWRGKAEQCRYSHSMLQKKYRNWQRGKDFSLVLLSVVSTTLIGLYYRGAVQGEWVRFAIFFLPMLVILLQSLDHTVFCWTERASKHKSAVQIWGAWIREADFLEKKFSGYPKILAGEKLENTLAKYSDCMSQTPQIPNKKFLKYKMDFREYVLKSKAIDSMTLEDIANEKARGRHKAKDG